MPKDMTDRLLTAKEASELLRVSPGTLAVWRKQGTGPPFRRVGTRFRYYESEVREWLDQQEQDQ